MDPQRMYNPQRQMQLPKPFLQNSRKPCLSMYLSVCLSVHLFTYPSTYVHAYHDTWRFRGSYKWGYKSPNMACKFRYPTYNPTYNYP